MPYPDYHVILYRVTTFILFPLIPVSLQDHCSYPRSFVVRPDLKHIRLKLHMDGTLKLACDASKVAVITLPPSKVPFYIYLLYMYLKIKLLYRRLVPSAS